MRDHKVLSVRTVVAIGIGTAILFILKRFAVIPTGIANTNIDISYGFLGFIATLFGPIAGFFIGFLGHALNDFYSIRSALVDMGFHYRFGWLCDWAILAAV